MSYFHKVVRLRLEGGREAQRQREMEVKLEGEKDTVRRLERSLRQTRADCERDLLSQQKVWNYVMVPINFMKLLLDTLKISIC